MNKEKKKEKEMKTIDHNSILIISKYFDSIKDYINIEKTCKEYSGIIEEYHFNLSSFFS